MIENVIEHLLIYTLHSWFNKYMSLAKKLLYAVGIIMAVLGFYLGFQADKTTIYNYLFGLGQGVLYLIGGVAVLICSFRLTDQYKKKSLLFFSLGSFAWMIAAFIWGYYNIFSNIELPQPSIADGFFILHPILTAIGCYYFFKSQNQKMTFQDTILPVIVVSFLFFTAIFFITWSTIIADDSILKIILNLQYPISDGALFVIVFVLFQKTDPGISNITTVFLVSKFLQVFADISYLVFVSFNVYWNGGPPDVLYALSAFFSSLSLIYLAQHFSST